VHASGLASSLPLTARRVHGRGGGQLGAFVAVLAVAGAILAFGTMRVPIQAPVLPPSQVWRHWGVAALALTLVATVDTLWLAGVALSWRRQARGTNIRRSDRGASIAATLPPSRGWLAPLAVLRPEVVPTRVIIATAATALAMVIAATAMAFPPWVIVSAAVAPWFPLLFAEGIRKYEHYGFYVVFGGIALLQVAHLGEHTVQVGQVLMTRGDLSRAHGVFGQLDFETVHFVWDSLVWFGLGALLLRFGATNRWLWVSFAAASVHEIEHLYLYYVFHADPSFYANGGYTGIMGLGGVIGSPLARPYLHFAYNVCVIVPLLFAFWAQTRRVYEN
jgi:hypothetical protein